MKIWSWRHAIQIADIPSPTKLVLLNLSVYHNDRGEGFWPSYERQAIDTGLSRRSVIEHINNAVELGFLEKIHEYKENGCKTSNRYFPHIPEKMILQQLQGVVQEVHHGSAGGAPGVVQEVHPIESIMIESNDINNKTSASREKKDAANVDIPDCIPLPDWNDFVAMRKAIRKPLTARAAEINIKKLIEWHAKGHDVSQILQTSVANCYQGLFEPKQMRGSNGITQSGPVSFADRRAQQHDEGFKRAAEKIYQEYSQTDHGDHGEPAEIGGYQDNS